VSCIGMGSMSRMPVGEVGLTRPLPLRCLTSGFAGGWMYCSVSLAPTLLGAIAEFEVSRRVGSGGGLSSSCVVLILRLFEVLLRAGGRGGTGRGFVRTVPVDEEETVRLG
jgi:hypothetical protein